jgi:hypothetical protein
LCWIKRWKRGGTAEGGGKSRRLSWTSIAIIIISMIMIIFNGVSRLFPALLAWWRRNDLAYLSGQRARKERERETRTHGEREREREIWGELIAQKHTHTSRWLITVWDPPFEWRKKTKCREKSSTVVDLLLLHVTLRPRFVHLPFSPSFCRSRAPLLKNRKFSRLLSVCRGTRIPRSVE